ncbi:MAG: NnrS family protein [Gammaproteobacteria bacterium]|nr:MAG: NnrS family protein [Gammaproteobacteria bacterium]
MSGNGTHAGRLFFPAAALFSLIAVPLWWAMMEGWLPVTDPLWHGHEMLFGYALGVVAGYLIQRPSPLFLSGLFLLWLSARIAALLGHPLFPFLSLAFAVMVAWHTVPPFLRAAKKFQNRAFAPLLASFPLAEGLFLAGTWLPELRPGALLLGIDLFAFLLILMGGRAIAPAIAGHLQRKGYELKARVQPAIEKALIVALASAIFLDLTPLSSWGGIPLLLAALLVAVRWLRWRPWRALGAPPLWTLLLGYLWLVPGLALKGWAQLTGLPVQTALHALTVGALGTLTLAMMARTDALRRRKGIQGFEDVELGVLLIGAAAALRLGEALGPASALWSLAFLLLLIRLLRA